MDITYEIVQTEEDGDLEAGRGFELYNDHKKDGKATDWLDKIKIYHSSTRLENSANLVRLVFMTNIEVQGWGKFWWTGVFFYPGRYGWQNW